MKNWNDAMISTPLAPSARRGSATVTALTILTPVMIAGGSLLSAMTNLSREVEASISQASAKAIASSGAHMALARIAAGDFTFGNFTFELNGGTASVTIVDLSQDGLDSDNNGLVDDAAEAGLVQVRAEGWVNADVDGGGEAVLDGQRWHRSVVQSTLQTETSTLAVPELPVFFGSDSPAISLDGTVYTYPYDFSMQEVSGGTVTSTEPLSSSTTSTEPDLVQRSTLDSDAAMTYEASTVDPSSTWTTSGESDDDSEYYDSDAMTLAESYTQMEPTLAETVVAEEPQLDECSELFDPLLQFVTRDEEYHSDVDLAVLSQALADKGLVLQGGTVDSPNWTTFSTEVVYAAGDLTLTGEGSGTGVLVVDGDLHVDGNLQWEGVVLATGDVYVNGDVQLHGSLWIQGTNEGPALTVIGQPRFEHDPEKVKNAIAASGIGDEGLADPRLLTWAQDAASGQ